MDEDIFPDYDVMSANKTDSTSFKKLLRSTSPSIVNNIDNSAKESEESEIKRESLTTKTAVEFLLEGKLKSAVCRYCLHISPALSELDQVLQIAGSGALYKVTIREIIACFYPFKVNEDPNFPEKICQNCVDRALNAYLFTQQCERAERALLNCFTDIYEKFDKLDPINRPKKRGRQKLNPNYNIIHAEHEKVIDYAEPIMNIINIGAESVTKEPDWNEFECKKCWQVLPNMESLLNHEITHPKFMWYHCRLCGKSFPKLIQLKKHHTQVHVHGKGPKTAPESKFHCNQCGNVSDSYSEHLQHVEKHKFKRVMQDIIEKKTDKLCLVCLDKGADLVELDKMVCVHGGHPELMGDKTLYTILASTLPDMNYLHNFIGTKICEKCLNHAITSYIFIHQFMFTRERLDLCVSVMLNKLELKPETNLFVQISPETVMKSHEDIDETLLLDEEDVIDENLLKVDVLEDEFRKSESDSDSEMRIQNQIVRHNEIFECNDDFENPAKNVTKTYARKMVNGLQSSKYPVDVCSEFLTFNKKKKVDQGRCKFTCPLCNKHFISEYFLKRHILKHVNNKVQCATCQNKFKSKFYLYEHTKMTHLLNISDYNSCNTCGRCFTSVDKLRSHEKHHKTKPCELCNKVFVTQEHYESHIQRHSDKLKLIKQKTVQTCSFCEKECSNDNELSLHVNKVHLQIKPYSCDMCERQFYTENNLKNHKKIHSMGPKEACEFCNKILKSRKQLVIHVRKHIGVKPFCCQVCGQGFYSTFKAREHMKVYHGGKFCCRICKSTFVTKYGLKEHVNKDHSII
ncbi:unnamed protein product [Chrysodeixis includens]|uniref:Uncharacterized protein n=1 Tax=Chrysodeixis includens TaxID=689277 RepID=A0A9P0BV05_CHRIL|nr:unnamed protein product [Chrysodeixis includens]